MQEYIYYENSEIQTKQNHQSEQYLNAFSFEMNTDKSPQPHQVNLKGEPSELINTQNYAKFDWKKYQEEQNEKQMVMTHEKQSQVQQKAFKKNQEEEPQNTELVLDQIFYEENNEYESDNSQDLKKEDEESVENSKPRKRRRKTLITDSQKVVKMKKELQSLMKDAKISEDQKKKVGYKLKNRISAQQSRDRQKAYIEEIELKNKKLKSENDSLLHENQKLKKENSKLQLQVQNLTSQQEFQQQQQKPSQPISSNVRSISKASAISFTFLTFVACICLFSFVNDHYRQNFLMKQKFINPEAQRKLQEQQWIIGELKNMDKIKESIQSNEYFGINSPNIQISDKFLGEKNLTQEQNYLNVFCTKAEIYLGKTTYSQPIEFIQFFLPNQLFDKQSEGVMDMAVKVLSAKIHSDLRDIVYWPKIKNQNIKVMNDK